MVGFGGVSQQGAFHLELVEVARDDVELLQRVKGDAVQLDQHLGIAGRRIDAFQAQEAFRHP